MCLEWHVLHFVYTQDKAQLTHYKKKIHSQNIIVMKFYLSIANLSCY